MMNERKIKVAQVRSVSGRTKTQISTLRGLGLGKMHKIVQIEDTEATRGMLSKIRHLVKVL
jgi:large subunit ribosomal protein L30